MRRLAYLFGGAAAVGAGVYFVVYLYRWQWQRAILSGVLLLIVGVLLLGIVVLGRLTRIEERIRENDRRQEDVLARLRQTHTHEQGDRFRWLEDPASRTYVFVPVLMVTGVVLSVIAWLVQRIASVTARPAAVRVPMRDGQTPTPEEVQRLLDTVSESSGPVFVHCGAGVGRTGTMAAAYLVRTGQEEASGAVWRNLSVGPPSVEQIYYGLMLERERETVQPPLPVVAVSRLVDAPHLVVRVGGGATPSQAYAPPSQADAPHSTRHTPAHGYAAADLLARAA